MIDGPCLNRQRKQNLYDIKHDTHEAAFVVPWHVGNSGARAALVYYAVDRRELVLRYDRIELT